MSADDLYSDSEEESGCESGEQTDDEDDDETMEDDGYDDVNQNSDADIDDDLEHSSNGTGSGSVNNEKNNLCHDKARSCTLNVSIHGYILLGCCRNFALTVTLASELIAFFLFFSFSTVFHLAVEM